MQRNLLCYLVLLMPLLAFGQEDGMKQLLSKYDAYHQQIPCEKVFVQTDKPYYMAGDTIHYKAYLFQDGYAKPSSLSGVLYVELDNAAGKMVRQQMLPVVNGLTWADIPLDLKDIPEGSYVLRAYTNLMRNFGSAGIFKKELYISRANNNSTLIKADFAIAKNPDGNKLKTNLRFTNLNHQAIALKDMQLSVVNGKHTLFKSKTTTGIDGTLPFDFAIPADMSFKGLEIKIAQIGKNADTILMTIPIAMSDNAETDLQFMPESGSLVAGLKARVGFKAIGLDGRGKEIKGKIYDSKGVEQATFASVNKGMGSFEFTPQANEQYTAKIDGQGKVYMLPSVNNWGVALAVVAQNDDSIKLKMQLRPDAQNAPAHGLYYLIGEANDGIRYAVPFVFRKDGVSLSIPKSVFPTGVARLSLLNYNRQPLNERLVFVDHNDQLHINVIPNKTVYALRDSVALSVQVTDEKGKAIRGAFSLAVTDDGQVRTDSLANNMRISLLLTSDLKGAVEDPGYYFRDNTEKRKAELDNLLLTQGWTGYNWKAISTDNPIKPEYEAEREYTLRGRVVNGFNGAIKEAKLNLLSPKPLFARDTTTNNEGKYVFSGMFPTDSSHYVIQARKKKGSPNVSIEADDFKQPVFEELQFKAKPWYVNSDTLMLRSAVTNIAMKEGLEKMQFGSKVLKEVKINDKKFIADSKNLNGSGNASFVMDEEEMHKQKKKFLIDLFEEKFGNLFKVAHSFYGDRYMLRHEPMILFLNGMLVAGNLLPPSVYMEDLNADQVKGIEVMYNPNYSLAYSYEYARQAGGPWKPELINFTYVEVTTFTGQMTMVKVPNLLVYDPMPFTLPKDFYRPKYTIANVNNHPGSDLRSTIHWEPNVVTDQNGKATVTFYTSDRPANYTIVMEGSDMSGHIGSVTQKLTTNERAKTP